MKNINRLELQKKDGFWAVYKRKNRLIAKIVAEIHLDHWRQIDQVLISVDASEEIVESVLRLAASHVRLYVRDRRTTIFGGLMVAEHRNQNLTEADSDKAMDFALIDDEIHALDCETIKEELNRLGIEVLSVTYSCARDGIKAALSILKEEADLVWESLPQRGWLNDRVLINLKVQQPDQKFTLWKSESRPYPEETSNLHVIPNYHPVMLGKNQAGLINGSTDCLIGGKAVRYIYAPEDARTTTESYGSSWNRVNHPFRVDGTSVEFGLIENHMRTKDGVNEFVDIVRGVLNLNDTYIAVSGGFYPPLKCAHNRLLEIGQLNNSPYPHAPRPYQTGKNVSRGSEAHCVWAHRVLDEEGVLEDSYVPQWLYTEGWLELYETAEVQHGLY